MADSSYAGHVALRRERAATALQATGYEGMVLGAGQPTRYFADDQYATFRTNPHFTSWLPLAGPGHLLHVRSGERPRLVRVVPQDYWHWHEPPGEPFWAGEFDIVDVADGEAAWRVIGSDRHTAFIGSDCDGALRHGYAQPDVCPAGLLARLDWDRSRKGPYEVACIEEAARRAGAGHQAARTAFEAGASELELHRAYVAALGCVDAELPYESIVALDAHAATLHYTRKDTRRDGRVFLIDCGARYRGYCSDITRTWTRPACDALFRELVIAMDAVQRSLCEQVRPGISYVDLHVAAHLRIADLLYAVGVLMIGGEEALERGLTHPFFPHGLGHFLGVQVHDIGGHQREPAGGTLAPPAEYPYLRTTRRLEVDQVFTIEPGIYFIDMLLEPLRHGPQHDAVDWSLVERLGPCGGVRIEDDVLVTADGHRNLTRPFT